jgi:hypothetical protein
MTAVRSRSLGRLVTLALAGMNLLLVSITLLLPGLAGVSQQQTVFLSVLVLSVQAGQAVVVQVGKSFPNRWYSSTVIAIVLLSTAGVLEVVVPSLPALVTSCAIGIAGVLFGTYVGSLAQAKLAVGAPASYQLVLLTRSVTWAAVLAIGLFFTSLGVLPLTLIAWLVVVLSGIGRAKTSPSNVNVSMTLLAGAAAGLLYRNDVSLARAASLGDLFHEWNVALVAYSLSQALLGFVVVNEIFSRRSLVRQRYTPPRAFALRTAVLVSLPVTAGAGIAVDRIVTDDGASILIQTALLIAAGTVVAFQASLAHVVSASWTVYAGGAAGFAALVACYSFGIGPAVGLLIELLTSGVLVSLLTYAVQRRTMRSVVITRTTEG